jgi:membrane protein required for colicin V production
MNPLDVALVILLLLSALRGTWRGFFRESFGFVALVLGLWAALRGAPAGAAWLAAHAPLADLNGTAVLGVAFVAIFLFVSTLLNLIGIASDQLFGRGPLRIATRAGGALFALAKGTAVLAFVLLFLQLFPIVPGIDRQIMDSRIARPMVSAAGAVLRSGWREGSAENRQA